MKARTKAKESCRVQHEGRDVILGSRREALAYCRNHRGAVYCGKAEQPVAKTKPRR